MEESHYENRRFEFLAEKFINKTISESELNELESWYAELPDDAPIWNLNDESKDQFEARKLAFIKSHITFHKNNSLWQAIKIAASIVLVCGVVLLISKLKKSSFDTVQNIQTSSYGKITKVFLPDHSIVWLKGNSKIIYPSRFSDSTRNVTLIGEALFEISKDHLHPFIIKTSKYITRVLGTSFNIEDNVELKTFKLTVLTGKVSIVAAHNGAYKLTAPTIVTPGKEFEISEQQEAPNIAMVPPSKKAVLLHGTEYDMNFENTDFAEIRDRIQRKFNVIITVKNANYNGCKISADVTDQSLENTLKVMKSILSLRNYKINNNQITFTGGGCS